MRRRQGCAGWRAPPPSPSSSSLRDCWQVRRRRAPRPTATGPTGRATPGRGRSPRRDPPRWFPTMARSRAGVSRSRPGPGAHPMLPGRPRPSRTSAARPRPQRGNKAVALIVDPGPPQAAPDGQVPPAGLVACVEIADDATGYQVLRSALEVRTEGGLVCGIDGYPSGECAPVVDDPPAIAVGRRHRVPAARHAFDRRVRGRRRARNGSVRAGGAVGHHRGRRPAGRRCGPGHVEAPCVTGGGCIRVPGGCGRSASPRRRAGRRTRCCSRCSSPRRLSSSGPAGPTPRGAGPSPSSSGWAPSSSSCGSLCRCSSARRSARRSCWSCPGIGLPPWLAGIRLGGDVMLESVLMAFYDGLRLATILVCVGAANSLASPARLLKSVPAALYELGVSVVVALTFTPQLVSDVERLRTARRLRGRETTGPRAIAASAVPVLEGALERSVTLAAAMDSRGYGRRGSVPARRATRILDDAARRARGGLHRRVRPRVRRTPPPCSACPCWSSAWSRQSPVYPSPDGVRPHALPTGSLARARVAGQRGRSRHRPGVRRGGRGWASPDWTPPSTRPPGRRCRCIALVAIGLAVTPAWTSPPLPEGAAAPSRRTPVGAPA